MALPSFSVRRFRRADAPYYARWLAEEFREEQQVVGFRPEGMKDLIDRAYRLDVRLLLGLFRLARRPIFRLFIAEQQGTPVGMAFLGFGKRAGYIASVVTSPEMRGRGVATAIMGAAHAELRRFGRPYSVLDVLLSNEGARRLYRKLGYEPIRESRVWVGAETADPAPLESEWIRELERSDLRPLLELAKAETPPAVQESTPVNRLTFARGTGWAAFEGPGSHGWVLLHEGVPSGFLRTTFGRLSPVGHLSAPLFGPKLGEAERLAALRYASSWLGRQGARGIVCELPEDLPVARATVVAAGFTPAYGQEQLRCSLAAHR
ncbi:MAG: GNAT family N-acetyltransferase [Thermoplasmata archaeon]|nr:GNAT family N-acetyltransferase [Thermoplasmata archaeon]